MLNWLKLSMKRHLKTHYSTCGMLHWTLLCTIGKINQNWIFCHPKSMSRFAKCIDFIHTFNSNSRCSCCGGVTLVSVCAKHIISETSTVNNMSSHWVSLYFSFIKMALILTCLAFFHLWVFVLLYFCETTAHWCGFLKYDS